MTFLYPLRASQSAVDDPQVPQPMMRMLLVDGSRGAMVIDRIDRSLCSLSHLAVTRMNSAMIARLWLISVDDSHNKYLTVGQKRMARTVASDYCADTMSIKAAPLIRLQVRQYGYAGSRSDKKCFTRSCRHWHAGKGEVGLDFRPAPGPSLFSSFLQSQRPPCHHHPHSSIITLASFSATA